jgi:hypothetical protein
VSKKRRSKPKKAVSVLATPALPPVEAPKPEPIDHAVADGFRDLDDTRRMLAKPGEYMEIGREDHYELADIVYTGFANELSLEVGMLKNLSMMANGIVQAVLAGNWMTPGEFQHYAYAVARDIRDRARAGARVLELRNDVKHREGGAS